MADGEESEVFLCRIEIEMVISEDGEQIVQAKFEDRDGEMPALVTVLGMLELTKDTAIRMAMSEDEGE